jgi:NTE family protein
VPGLLPAVRVGRYHYLDGGLVDSIPLGRAVELGARRVFVLQVGRIEQALAPPRNPWEVGAVAFEIARRHRFARDLATAPDDVEVHVLPAGEGAAPRWNSREALRYRDFAAADRRIEGAYAAAAAYLEKVVACH